METQSDNEPQAQVQDESSSSATTQTTGMSRNISPRQLKIIFALVAIVVILVLAAVAMWSAFSPAGEGGPENQVSPPTGSEVRQSGQNSDRKEYESQEFPPGIPANLPNEGVREVIQNYQYTSEDGERQSVRQFIVAKNSFDAMVVYSDFFIKEGWIFSPALVVNTDEQKISGAYKNEDFLQIVTTPLSGERDVSKVEISIIRK